MRRVIALSFVILGLCAITPTVAPAAMCVGVGIDC
jgi:hypothetical protein